MKKIWGEIWCWVATIIIEGKRRCWEVMVLTSPYSPFTSFSSVWKVTSKLVSAQHPRLSCRTTSHLSWKCNPCSLIRGPWNISNYLHFTVGFTVKDLKMMISNDVVRLSKPLKVKPRNRKTEKYFRRGYRTHLLLQASRRGDALLDQVVQGKCHHKKHFGSHKKNSFNKICLWFPLF